MSTMQDFYANLLNAGQKNESEDQNAPEVHDPYFQALAQLKQASRVLVESTSLEWDVWAVDPA